MSEPLPEFHLGIIGGCMSHQRGTPLNALYHRQLAVLLARDPGVRLRPHIVRDFGLDYVSRLDRLLARSPVDGVLAHIRVTITAGARPLLSDYVDGQTRRRLNPALFRRGHNRPGSRPAGSGGPLPGEDMRGPDAYGDEETSLQDMPPPGRRIGGFRLRNLNYALGALAGLDGWAIDDELLRFDELARACGDRGVPLFVLGPTPATLSYWTTRMTTRANLAIGRHLAGTAVPCALIHGKTDEAGRPLIRADGFHATLDCHRFVAEQLYEQGMREWVGGILNAREMAGL